MAEVLNLQGAINLARNVPALAASVTVVDDAGKVVTTSKNIFGAFKQAREAYKARKAEIAAERSGEATRRREARLREARRLERREHKFLTASAENPEDGDEAQRKKEKKRLKSRKNRSTSSREDDASSSALTRRDSETMETESEVTETIYSSGAMAMIHNNASLLTLAPAMLVAGDPLADTLQMLLMQLQNTIDEMSCITAGIGALISELQKVPDTLAVVGLTLAEISAIVAKISPAAIMGLKSAFPVIFGLLGSPQFAVVAGVGIAATVVVLGGYKIIKNVVGAGPKDPNEEERDLDLEFGVTTLPDEVDEPVSAPAPAPSAIRAIMPPPTQLENEMNTFNMQDADKEKERKKAKRNDSEESVKVKSEKSLESVSSDKSDKDRSHKDKPTTERRESSRKHDKSDKRERSERREKRERSNSSKRSDKSEKSEKGEKSDRSDKNDRSDKHERSDKSGKGERIDKKKKELTINPTKFSLTRRASAPDSPMEPSRPSLPKRTMTMMGSASKSEEKLKAPKKKLLASWFDGRS